MTLKQTFFIFIFIFLVNMASPESAFVPCKYIKSCLAAVEMTDEAMDQVMRNDDDGINV